MDRGKLNQKEYLRQYLSKENDKAKKRKQKTVKTTVKIIDDDIPLKIMRPVEDDTFEIASITENAPQIVGVEREKRSMDFGDKRRWKIMTDNGEGNTESTRVLKHKTDSDAAAFYSSTNYTDKESEWLRKLEYERHGHKIFNSSKDPHQLEKVSKKRRSTGTFSSCSGKNTSPIVTAELKSKKSSKNWADESSPDSVSSAAASSEVASTLSLKEKRGYNDAKSKSKDSKLAGTITYDSDLSPPRETQEHHNVNESFNAPKQILSKSRRRTSRKSKSWNTDSRNEDSYSRKESHSIDNTRGASKNDSITMATQKTFSEFIGRISTNSENSDSDLSPPRDSSKGSVHRRHRQRIRGKADAISDHSEHNRSTKSDKKSRLQLNDGGQSKSRTSTALSRADHRRIQTNLDGKTAGLIEARTLEIEIQAHKKRMCAEVSNAGQAVVFRDRRTGKKRDLIVEANERREKETRQKEIAEKYSKWGTGLKQVNSHAEKLAKDKYEMSKPLARYADDADLDKELREVIHADDPMLDYIKKKHIKERKSKPEMPNYQGTYRPNRFGIKPGYRWDGVDRSNGYEEKWFNARNAQMAVQEEAYKWSTADM